MPQRWIVDASNVVGSRPDGWWRDRPGALLRLVGQIWRWRAVTGDPVVVVVDGHPTAQVPEREVDGIEIRYARSTERDAADREIERVVAADPDPETLRVVTSDRRLRQRATELGADTEGAGRFLARIADIEPQRSDRASAMERPVPPTEPP